MFLEFIYLYTTHLNRSSVYIITDVTFSFSTFITEHVTLFVFLDSVYGKACTMINCVNSVRIGLFNSLDLHKTMHLHMVNISYLSIISLGIIYVIKLNMTL